MEEPYKIASFSPTIRRVISRRVLLAALMAIVCVLLVNILALRNPAKFALAQSADHSLSPLTKKVLGSLTNDVRVVALFDTESDLFEPVRNLLVEYERVSSRVKLELVDIARDPARVEAVQQELRSPANAPGNRVLFAVNERVKAVNDSELSILDFSEFMEKREARRTHFVGEQLFTSSIVAVTEGKQTKVGFVTGHGEHRASDQGGQWGYSKFALMLQQKGFLMQEVSLAGTNSIPADCRLLITAGPRTPYSPSELAKLREYLGSGGSLFALFNFYSLQRPSGLESFLADYEFEVGVNQVSDSKNEQSGESGLLLVEDLGSHPITKPILGSRLQMVLPRSVGFPSRRWKTTTLRRCRCSRIHPTPGRRWCRRRAIRARSRSRAGFRSRPPRCTRTKASCRRESSSRAIRCSLATAHLRREPTGTLPTSPSTGCSSERTCWRSSHAP